MPERYDPHIDLGEVEHPAGGILVRVKPESVIVFTGYTTSDPVVLTLDEAQATRLGKLLDAGVRMLKIRREMQANDAH
jgi:hypothetical protein